MDDMGTPGPNHPAHRGLKAPDNVVKLPMSRRTKMRHAANKIKEAIFEPEQVTYAEPFEPRERIEGALDSHINNAIENSGQADSLNAELGRTSHFEIGQQEAKIHHINEGREIKRRKESDNE